MVSSDNPPVRVIGVGASAGGVDALEKLVGGLPADLAHAVLVVLHVADDGRSLLGPILDRACALPVGTAADGDPVAAGHVLVAPSGSHLVVRAGRIALEHGPKQSAARPAVDALLRSLAAAYGARAVAVILSGALADGSQGARAVAQAGGTVLVQDPDDALVRSMPEAALRIVGGACLVLPAAKLGAALAGLSYERSELSDTEETPVPAVTDEGMSR